MVVDESYGSQTKAEMLMNDKQMEIIHLHFDVVLYNGMEMYILNNKIKIKNKIQWTKKYILFYAFINKRYMVIKYIVFVVEKPYESQKKGEDLLNHGEIEIIHLDVVVV